jgi:hypothetical protein
MESPGRIGISGERSSTDAPLIRGRDLAPIRTILLAVFAVMVSDLGAAQACAYRAVSGWTASGSGPPAAMVVLGNESCQGKIQGLNLQIVAPPRHGKVKVTGPSSYVYTPNRAFRGSDLIRVSADVAGSGIVIGTIIVTVQ